MKRMITLSGVLAVLIFTGIGSLSAQQQKQDRRPASLPESPTIGLELVAEDLSHPVFIAQPPDDSGRLFIVEQTGTVRIVDAGGETLSKPFLDIADRLVKLEEHYDERGLLGLAFHPGYADNGRFFVYYSAPLRPDAPEGFNNTSRLSEFSVDPDDPNRADPGSERILLRVDEPQMNHAGGTVTFGPDGYLYVSLGDGGGANDADYGHADDWYDVNKGGNAQNIEANLLGKILRLDVDRTSGGREYAIPADNPFVGKPGRDEIWAYGLRNPYRISFDSEGDRRLFAADAGQEAWEEVSIIEKGGNYGWNVKEGTRCFSTEHPADPARQCPDTDAYGNALIDPVIEFPNAKQPGGLGLVVVGGYVYRGDAIPELDGSYVFGVWSSRHGEADGRIYSAHPSDGPQWTMRELVIAERTAAELGVAAAENRLGGYLLGFGQDRSGELYVLSTEQEGPSERQGRVYRLVRPGSGGEQDDE